MTHTRTGNMLQMAHRLASHTMVEQHSTALSFSISIPFPATRCYPIEVHLANEYEITEKHNNIHFSSLSLSPPPFPDSSSLYFHSFVYLFPLVGTAGRPFVSGASASPSHKNDSTYGPKVPYILSSFLSIISFLFI